MKVFLVDGSALLYRSHYAFQRRPLTTSHGELTSAAFGVASSLMRLREEEAADAIVVVFDAKGKNFRHELYPEYKAHRPPMPEELAGQVERVHETVRALGHPLLMVEGVEADDVLGTLAREAAERGDEAWIYSGDKDFFPLLRDRVGILRPQGRGGEEVYLDEAGFKKQNGLEPSRFLDVLALMGDKADNVPGVPGVGEKTALKLVKDYGGIDGVLSHLDDRGIKPGIRRKLEENRELLELSRQLVTIDQEVELGFDWNSAALTPYPDRFYELCRELEFNSLLERLPARDSEAGEPAPKSEPQDLRYELVTELGRLDEVLSELAAEERPWSLDTETTSLDPLRAELVGLSFCVDAGRAWYVPVDVSGGQASMGDLFSAEQTQERLPWDEVRARLAPLLADPRRGFVGQNLKYDQLVLDHHGAPVAHVDFDTMIASYLLAPERRQHNLDALADELLAWRTTPYKSLFEGVGSKDIREVPLERLAEYAAEDADVALRLSELFRPQLIEEELDHLLSDVELPLSQVLMRMERRGVRLDVPVLEELSAELRKRLEELETRCHELAGEPFNLNSPKQLQVILFEKLGLKPVKKTATGFSTDVEVLTKLADEHELPQALLEYRQSAKLLSTYAEALPRLVNPDTGCVHTSYNQAVAATGRLSSTDPNLQNIPVRSEQGRRIRRAFVPREEGWCLLAADYSQIELRLMAHLAGDEALLEAFRKGEDIHATTAAAVAGVGLDEVDSEMRGRAKAINFGILYGMGARALAQTISVSTKEAAKFIEEYFARFPRVRAFIDETVERAREEGEVRTILGRRRRLPEIRSKNPQQRAFGERIAVNTPIQGSAADLIKVAMIRLDERIEREELPARLLLQVHDELVLELEDGERERVGRTVKEEMEGVFELSVPLVVDLSFGDNWAEAKS